MYRSEELMTELTSSASVIRGRKQVEYDLGSVHSRSQIGGVYAHEPVVDEALVDRARAHLLVVVPAAHQRHVGNRRVRAYLS